MMSIIRSCRSFPPELRPENDVRRYSRRQNYRRGVKFSVRRHPAAQQHCNISEVELEQANSVGTQYSGQCCPVCTRRHLLGALASTLISTNSKSTVVQASPSNHGQDPKDVLQAIHPSRPIWYEEMFAIQMDQGMKAYETQSGLKAQLFNNIDSEANKLLEIGIGTGPNIRYYANRPRVSIIGVDPNVQMEKYARDAASKAGFHDSQFKFLHGVGEALPVTTSSVDVVICTLVLCSVEDVAATLREVKRVLRPGGSFLFVEHVVGSDLRFWQNLLDPVQQFFADGCHLTRDTLSSIQEADFAALNTQSIEVPNVSLLSPHILGMARV